MSQAANNVFNQAIELSSLERAEIAERLLISLDTPDTSIDAIWAKESNARIEAYERGEVEVISADHVFSKYNKP